MECHKGFGSCHKPKHCKNWHSNNDFKERLWDGRKTVAVSNLKSLKNAWKMSSTYHAVYFCTYKKQAEKLFRSVALENVNTQSWYARMPPDGPEMGWSWKPEIDSLHDLPLLISVMPEDLENQSLLNDHVVWIKKICRYFAVSHHWTRASPCFRGFKNPIFFFWTQFCDC